MKKILAALLVASFGAGLMAQSLVYDYKASIKRLDAQFAAKTANKSKFVAASYKVASDTIQGYIVLPKCNNCNAGTITSTVTGSQFNDKAYLIRKGDKLSKKYEKPYVLITPVNAKAALFGAYTKSDAVLLDANGNKIGEDTSPRASIKAANKAWMSLNYNLPNNNVNIEFDKILRGFGTQEVVLGFLGLTNDGVADNTLATVRHTGFGAAASDSKDDKPINGLCGNDTDPGYYCQWVTSISGTLVGYPGYTGPCGKTPMWDVCYPVSADNVTEGVISGTWTLKYNKSITTGYNGTSAANKETYILSKLLKVKEEKVSSSVIIREKYTVKSSN